MSEIDIQRDILMSIGMYPQLKAFRMNNAAIYDAKRGCYRSPGPWFPKGLPDIMILSDIGISWLEVKQPGKDQSDDQIDFQSTCDKYHIKYAVVTSPAEAREFLRFWGVIGGELI